MFTRVCHVLAREWCVKAASKSWTESTIIPNRLYRSHKNIRPPSKSKLNYVRKPTPRDPWETEFLREKYKHYRTMMKSLSAMFKEELEGKTGGINLEDAEKQAQEEHRIAMEWNKQENERVRLIREARQAMEAAEDLVKRTTMRLTKEENRLQLMAEREEIVRKEKDVSKTFITLETLDEAIERALADPVDFNFAINKDGQKMYKNENIERFALDMEGSQ
ncbi:small ribosomal subunit protein mS26-like [Glandiceps talaboti]